MHTYNYRNNIVPPKTLKNYYLFLDLKQLTYSYRYLFLVKIFLTNIENLYFFHYFMFFFIVTICSKKLWQCFLGKLRHITR